MLSVRLGVRGGLILKVLKFLKFLKSLSFLKIAPPFSLAPQDFLIPGSS